ncbi:MAG TPA: hypothetical protein DGG95_01985 [Cytophagales bacterium]|jgi:hypothetical protein|nr:hypothetical protein [Cytophagales bacterium]
MKTTAITFEDREIQNTESLFDILVNTLNQKEISERLNNILFDYSRLTTEEISRGDNRQGTKEVIQNMETLKRFIDAIDKIEVVLILEKETENQR